jgi:hypothetical protein
MIFVDELFIASGLKPISRFLENSGLFAKWINDS